MDIVAAAAAVDANAVVARRDYRAGHALVAYVEVGPVAYYLDSRQIAAAAADGIRPPKMSDRRHQ